MILTDQRRATFVGILILLAYSMLAYTVTGHKLLGLFTDIVSGIAVITIPVLMFPLFDVRRYRWLNYGYMISRFIEGILMIIGGILILVPSLEDYRDQIYADIHIWFFISGALFFYFLFYFTRTIPAFISVWGIAATLLLLISTILNLFVEETMLLQLLLLPIILNEVFLAIWLMVKGFKITP